MSRAIVRSVYMSVDIDATDDTAIIELDDDEYIARIDWRVGGGYKAIIVKRGEQS